MLFLFDFGSRIFRLNLALDDYVTFIKEEVFSHNVTVKVDKGMKTEIINLRDKSFAHFVRSVLE